MTGKKSWRLSKTLNRRNEIRPVEQDDVKYAWAAYKSGSLSSMRLPEGLDASQFKIEFETYVLANAHGAWTVIVETPKGFIPAGFALGQWGPGQAFMFIVGIAWFPWASKRNILEGTVAFFNRIRKELAWLGFANDEHKPVYDVCCMHGIMSRVGTTHSLAQKMAVFQGRG